MRWIDASGWTQLGERMGLHIFGNDTLIVRSDADGILRSRILIYFAAFGDSFFSKHDNVKSHTIRLMENMLKVETIQLNSQHDRLA